MDRSRWLWHAGFPALVVMVLLTMLSLAPVSAGHLVGTSATYTLDADFDEGTLVNVNHDAPNNDQLQLDSVATPFDFIWVAVSTQGTIVKIDTNTGMVLGEYRTAPSGRGLDPSRTTVDANGNVWATNRAEFGFVPAGAIAPGVPYASNGMGSVVHVGLEENGQCVDKNGNSVIDTSTGLGDVRPWTNAGGADDLGGVSTAADECILHYTRVNSTGTRHVSVNTSNNVWTSGIGDRDFDLIDGSTGSILVQAGSVGYGGYGGLIDGSGVIWSARPLLRWDTTGNAFVGPNGDPAGFSIGPPALGSNWAGQGSPDSYGLCINPNNGEVWNTRLDGTGLIERYAPSGVHLGSFGYGSTYAQGCVVDSNGHVWVAHSIVGPGSTVGHLDAAGTWLGNVAVGSGPTGVAVDGNGKIWATNYYSRTVSRIDPTLAGGVGAVDLTTVDLGGNLYNYSDMTGSTLVAPPNSGTWTVSQDSGAALTEWGTITWNDEPEGATPGDSTLTVQARSSEDNATWSAFESVSYGVDLTVPNGRYLQVRVTFTRSTTTDADGDGVGDSPVLSDLNIVAEQEVSLDIKPQSCPNPLNTKDRGVLPVAIVGTSDLDVTQVDVSTVQLEGVSPLRWSIVDVATPYTGGISDPPDRLDCTTGGADGILDLTLKFDSQAIVAALGSVNDGDVVVLHLTGNLLNGTPIVGEDVVWIRKK